MARIDAAQIVETLRREILAGDLAPGHRLPEVTLAARFGVSRTPVREALAGLRESGLLERGERGLQVRRIDPRELMQVYDLRALLEARAAAEAAQHASEIDLARLGGLLARDRAWRDPSDAERISANQAFHEALWDAAHDRVLKDLLGRLSTHQVHAPTSTLSVGDRWAVSLDEHAALVAAIGERRAADAAAIATAHLAEARRIRLEMFASVRP